MTEERKQQMEIAYKKQTVADFLVNYVVDTSRITYTTAPKIMGSMIVAYEKNIMEAVGVLK